MEEFGSIDMNILEYIQDSFWLLASDWLNHNTIIVNAKLLKMKEYSWARWTE